MLHIFAIARSYSSREDDMTVKTYKADANWKRLLKESLKDVRDLGEPLRLTEEEIRKLDKVQEKYPFFANPYYLSLMHIDNPDDPIRRMCIPSEEELDLAGLADTSGETTSTVLPGLQHKYAETALVLSTSQCALYCRHCFRRRFVGLADDETVRDIEAVAAYIAEHAEITNVLISGGDALMNSNETIRRYLDALGRIDHVRSIRLGTRMPVVLPQRLTTDDELMDILAEASSRKQLHVVTQFNHPAEITPQSHNAVRMLLQAGIPVRNQTVLLNGVNDDSRVLTQLMNDLVGIGVTPYYVFQCRPTVGVKNRFQVPLTRGCQIVEHTRKQLNGLAKSFRFIMSHDMGKIEIIGRPGRSTAEAERAPSAQQLLLLFHQARDRDFLSYPFYIDISPTACWLSEAQLRMAFSQKSMPVR